MEQPNGLYSTLLKECFSHIAEALRVAVNKPDWDVARKDVRAGVGIEQLLFILKWQGLALAVQPQLLALLKSLNTLALKLDTSRGTELSSNSSEHLINMEKCLWETMRALLIQQNALTSAMLAPAVRQLWVRELQTNWWPLVASQGRHSTSASSPDTIEYVLRFMDACLECPMLSRWQPERVGVVAAEDYLNEMLKISNAASKAPPSNLARIARWWRFLVGCCDFTTFNECCRCSVPGQPSGAPAATFVALQALLGDEVSYLRCCVTLARTLVGRQEIQRREFSKILAEKTENAKARSIRSTLMIYVNLLLRALQPWLVAAEGQRLRQWTHVSCKLISQCLTLLLGVSWPHGEVLLFTALGSRSWQRGGQVVTLHTAVSDLLEPSTIHFATRADIDVELEQSLRFLCGARCAVAVLEGSAGLLAVPTDPAQSTTRCYVSTEDLVTEIHPDTWDARVESAITCTKINGLFAQRAAEPSVETPPLSLADGGLQSIALALLQKAFVASGHNGGLLDYMDNGYSFMWESLDTETIMATGCNSTSCSIVGDKLLNVVSTSPGQLRAAAIDILVVGWQRLLNTIGRVAMSQAPRLSDPLEQMSNFSQGAFTFEAGESQIPGTRMRVYPTEDQLLQAAVNSVCNAHALIWAECWAVQLTLPRRLAFARETYLEALWWLLHRLSAFNVIQDAHLIHTLLQKLGSNAPPLPSIVARDKSICALWFVMLPTIAHSRSAQSPSIQTRLTYAISRCQRALLQASPPVLEEIIVWLPQMINVLQATSVESVRGYSADTAKKGQDCAAEAGNVALYLRADVHDDFACMIILGTVWQTVLLSLTRDLAMPAFPGWSQLGLSSGTPSDTPSSTVGMEALLLRRTILAPFAQIQSGQTGLSHWLSSFPYSADKHVTTGRSSWRRLCKMWLPYEVHLATEALHGRGDVEWYFKQNQDMHLFCGGVYTRDHKASVLAPQELLAGFDVLDGIAVALHESPKDLPANLTCSWGKWLRAHALALVLGWYSSCLDILAGDVKIDDHTCASIVSASPALRHILEAFARAQWMHLLLQDPQEDLVIQSGRKANASLVSADQDSAPKMRPVQYAGSALTLSPSASTEPTQVSSAVREIYRGSAIIVIAKLMDDATMLAMQRLAGVLDGIQPPSQLVSAQELLQYVGLLIRSIIPLVQLLSTLRAHAPSPFATKLTQQLQELHSHIGVITTTSYIKTQASVNAKKLQAVISLLQTAKEFCHSSVQPSQPDKLDDANTHIERKVPQEKRAGLLLTPSVRVDIQQAGWIDDSLLRKRNRLEEAVTPAKRSEQLVQLEENSPKPYLELAQVQHQPASQMIHVANLQEPLHNSTNAVMLEEDKMQSMGDVETGRESEKQQAIDAEQDMWSQGTLVDEGEA